VAARARFEESITRVREILPNCEVGVLSAAEIAFRWRGLEFARARVGGIPGSFRSTQEIVFGVGAEERILEPATNPNLLNWRTVYAMCATPTARANILCGGFVPKDGWSRSWWAM